jgi:flagellar motor switch protein FliG
LSELVALEDLEALSADDLVAVFRRVEPGRLALALASLGPQARERLLSKLTRSWARRLIEEIEGRGAVDEKQAEEGRRSVLDALVGLCRHGQVAFDDPEDILDMVA